MMRAMGSFVVAAALLTGSVARGDVKIADDVRHGAGKFSGIDYGISDAFQRAWLVLHFQFEKPCVESENDVCDEDRPVQLRLPGLAYDPSLRQVTYAAPEGESVVCANLVRHRILWSTWESAEPTGNCGYRLQKVDRFVDDGFQGREDRREEIYFTAKGR